MKRRMIIMLMFIAILFGFIFIFKGIKGFFIGRYMAANQTGIVYVSALKTKYTLWQQQFNYVGSVRAIRGVDVTTELAGMVQTIYFVPGSPINEGVTLVQLNADSDIASLHALQANAALAQIVYQRDHAQYLIEAVSKATVDADQANLKSTQAQVDQQLATVAKKTIRAPFSGRLGISAVNPGQYLNPGDKVVTLQQLDPIYVDFFVPQQVISKMKTGQDVTVTTDSFPGKVYTGKITTINPAIDTNTRNVEVEATITNSKLELTPGMFTSIIVTASTAERFLTLPQTAVSFNPYGEVIYLIKEKGKDKKGNPILIAQQTFIKTGEKRGDQVAITEGLKADDLVVTSGQLKLKNESLVAINNSVTPLNNPIPTFVDE